MYKDVRKAVYAGGRYILKFIKGYEEWREMSIQEKHNHLKSFFSFIPSEAGLKPSGIKLSEINQTNADLRIKATAVQHELNSVLQKEQQTAESFLNNYKFLPQWKKVPITPSDLDIHNVPKTAISAILSEADLFLERKRRNH